jgi:nicotinamide-nucleotide adenylyltransferase
MKVGFLGRFQPLHKGHHKVIEDHRDEYGEFKVIIGSSGEERTEDNPLSFEERKDLIQTCFPDIEVIGVEDETKDEEGNRKWIQKIEDTGIDAVISQNDLVQMLVGEYTDLKLIEQEMHDKGIYSGTETRRRIRSGEEWRYLVPKCCTEKIADLVDDIKESGTQYDFEPGWKRENAYHDTYEK